MKRVIDKLSDKRPKITAFKKDSILVEDKKNNVLIKKSVKPVYHSQVVVKTDIEKNTVNAIMLTSKPKKYQEVSTSITKHLKELEHKFTVSDQSINAHQVTVPFYKESLSFVEIKNPLFNFEYYKANIDCILLMSKNNEEIQYLFKNRYSLKEGD